MMKLLDCTDKKTLRALQQHPGATYRELAQLIGVVSFGTLHERIKVLINYGFITKHPTNPTRSLMVRDGIFVNSKNEVFELFAYHEEGNE